MKDTSDRVTFELNLDPFGSPLLYTRSLLCLREHSDSFYFGHNVASLSIHRWLSPKDSKFVESVLENLFFSGIIR